MSENESRNWCDSSIESKWFFWIQMILKAEADVVIGTHLYTMVILYGAAN